MVMVSHGGCRLGSVGANAFARLKTAKDLMLEVVKRNRAEVEAVLQLPIEP